MKRLALPGSVLLAAVLVGGGCAGAYGRRVPDELFEKLAYDQKIELLEAENELAVAIDRVDEARSEASRARDNLERARARVGGAEEEIDRAADAPSKEIAQLSLVEAEARAEYLEKKRELELSRADVERLALRCAAAKFEESRLAVLRKAKVEGSERVDPAEFAEQTKACEADLAEERAELTGPTKETETLQAAWEEKRKALAKRTFDAKVSPFVE